MKPYYIAFMLLIAGRVFGQEQPAFISITPSALEHIAHVHEAMSGFGNKYLSLVLTTGKGGKNSDGSLNYSIKFESLIIGGNDAPPSGTIPIKIRELKFRITPELVERLKKSTIDLVHLLSTDGKVDEISLVLRPSDPIIVERYETKKIEQAVTPNGP